MSIIRSVTVIGGIVAAVSGSVPASATLLDPNFVETSWFTSTPFANATSMAWAPDGSNRLFITHKQGAVRIVKNGAILATPFATETVFTASECGLLGVAFDPNFVQNGYVYFFKTLSATEQQIIRYTATGDIGTSRTAIVTGLPTRGANHDGGGLGFGPDGKLYFAIGDLGDSTGTDANLTSLAAKVGRANRDGSVAPGNPFADGAGPNNDFIWARGFRNPFALAFQPGAGNLWVEVAGTSYEQIFVVPAGGHAGYDDYENNQPAGFLTPAVAYRTGGVDVRTLSNASRVGGLATFTTVVPHGFRKGGKITVAGVGDSTFNGATYVASVPTPATFTFVQPGPNASSSGGTATTDNVGSAVVGGDFWDSSGVPLAYRGNFFFGDYVSGRVQRVSLAPDGTVASVDGFVTGVASAVDVAAGPDGALYLLAHSGSVLRVSHGAVTQGLIVSPLHVRMDEGGRAIVNVRLAMAPAAGVTVTSFVSSGDPDVSTVSGGTLAFDSANWSVPQSIVLQAAADADLTPDLSTLTASASGLLLEPVEVRVTDLTATVAAAVPAGRQPWSALLVLLVAAATALSLKRSPGR